MQILFETVLFCLAITAPALIASSFKSDSARHAGTDRTANGFAFSRMPSFRWLGKRKRVAAM